MGRIMGGRDRRVVRGRYWRVFKRIEVGSLVSGDGRCCSLIVVSLLSGVGSEVRSEGLR